MLEEAPAAPSERSGLSVGKWLTLLVVALFVGPLLVSNLWGYLQSRRYLTEAAFRSTRDLAALAAAETGDFVRDASAVVPALLESDPELLAAIRAAAAAPADRVARARLHERLHVGAAGSAEVDELQVVSRGGAVLASSRTDEASSPDLAAALCFQRGRFETTAVGFDPRDGSAPQMLVAIPIRDAGAGLGVFCARVRFTRYQRLLATLGRRSGAADIHLLDEQRRVIAVSADGSIAGSEERLAWLPATAGDHEWAARGDGPGGAAMIVAYSPVAGPDWAIVVTIPVATTLADLETLKWQAVALFASLLAVVALAVFLAWRTVVRPLRALAGTSERIADGAIGATVTAAGPREISDLAVAFNRMSLALRDSRQTLEDRIAARTRALHESEQFLELLVNSIDQRVIVTDPQFRIVKSNAAAERMHGRPLVGELCYRAFEGRDTPCEACPVARTFWTGSPATAERSQHTAAGQEPVSIETYPVRGERGQVASVIAISRVISGEKQLQARMAFQEKMAAFGQLAAGVAHELGNPLAAIDAQLQRAEGDPERAEQSVGVVRKEVARMARMLRGLVDFARRKRDEVRLASPNQVVEDVLRLIEHDPRAVNVTMVTELAPELPGVRLVEDHLVQVLLNLGLNALDALAGGGTLTYETRAVDGVVEVRVRDTGGGIAPEVAGHLFEPFHTTKARGRGTGLGLYVSKRIVDDMGGQLALEATGPTGTTFVVRLPVIRNQREAS